MTVNASAPWHAASFEKFLSDRLPALLAQRLPLAGFGAEATGPHACRVRIAVASGGGQVEVEYSDLPRPDEDGLFELDGARHVVIPTASGEDLDVAEIRCVGEQLYEYIEQRLGEAPPDLAWDKPLLRSWLPLDRWFRDFLASAGALDEENWLSVRTHLRRVDIPDRERLFAPGQLGRACPFETPEGRNIGRILSIAVGAEIRDGKVVIVEDSPEAALGLSASMVPFLEHNDPNRTLMGCNMMRQWRMPPEPEPACVRTGNEPDAPGFWCGRNLLTAFVSWGAPAYEDGIVLSESAAKRFGFADPIEPGDKLSNRHGTKGTVSRILPDEEMPHLADGTPVELVFSFLGLHTRGNFGQLREAVMGRIARATGEPIVVPPFCAPGQQEIRRRLAEAGLPESGMEKLAAGRGGKELARPSTVGWVYWGETHHLAGNKIHASVTPGNCQYQGYMECYTLRDLGAFETIGEFFNTRCEDRDDAASLADRVAAGPVEQAGPPSPRFAELGRRLAAGGIRADFDGERIAFSFAAPDGPTLKLARPVVHPWLRGRQLAEVGALEELDEYAALAEANAKLARLLDGKTPESLTRAAVAELQDRADAFLDALLTTTSRAFPLGVAVHLVEFGNRILFSGRAVLSVSPDLPIDQLGLAEEIAWTIFAPLVQRELGDAEEVARRSERAARALDEIMARSWVILNRAPTIMPTSLLAFHPVRIPERVIRLHPLCCPLMNADFDGDQAAVFLPITEAGQREAGQKLSVAAHLARDPELLKWMYPSMESLWGLAELSRTPGGRKEVNELAGVEVACPEGFVTRASLTEAMRRLLDRQGPEAVLAGLERLMRRGFDLAAESGASLSPFAGAGLDRPPAPDGDDPEAWERCAEELAERIAAGADYDGQDLGPQLLAVKSGARGTLRHLLWLLGGRGTVALALCPAKRSSARRAGTKGATAEPTDKIIIRRGLADGLSPEEMFACAATARDALGQVALDLARQGYGQKQAAGPKGFNVLARAMRARHPGIVFAHAAAIGESDPLADVDSRLFVGLPPQRRA